MQVTQDYGKGMKPKHTKLCIEQALKDFKKDTKAEYLLVDVGASIGYKLDKESKEVRKYIWSTKPYAIQEMDGKITSFTKADKRLRLVYSKKPNETGKVMFIHEDAEHRVSYSANTISIIQGDTLGICGFNMTEYGKSSPEFLTEGYDYYKKRIEVEEQEEVASLQALAIVKRIEDIDADRGLIPRRYLPHTLKRVRSLEKLLSEFHTLKEKLIEGERLWT